MTGRILRRILVAVSLFLMLATIPGPAEKFIHAQEAEPAEGDEPEEQEVPAPQSPQPPLAPRPRGARPPVATPGQPPVAAPERRMVPPATSRGDLVSLNFNRADLVEVIHVLAQHLRLTYTVDPDVKGTVTINSAEPLRKEDLFPVFHQILRMNDAVAVKTGDTIYRISPIAKGKGLARPAGPDREGGYAIQVVPVRFFSVAEMKRLLNPFVTPGGDVLDYPRGNFLIIVDLPSNIQRLMEIRDMIDVQTFVGTRTEIYEPKVASADELAGEMTKVMQAYASSASQAEGFAAHFLSLPRINQLLVIADSDAAWTYVKRWLERLDTIGEGPGRRIFVYPVENGKAAELADVLTQVLGITGGPRREQGRTLEQLHRRQPTPPTTPGFPRTPGTGFGTMGGAGATPGLFAAAPAQQQQPPAGQPPPTTTQPRQPQPPRPGETRPGEPRPQEEQLRVVADTTTNTLIIFGTAQEFQNIRTILRDLDIPPRQVVLECLVAEVKSGKDESILGFDYEILRGKGDKFTESTTDFAGFKKFPFQFGGTAGILALAGDSRVRGLINALQTSNRAKILASPTILATDNQPARIQVGDEVPVATGTISSSVTTDTGVTTAIQSRNTGKILTIIPQVNSRGLVNLQIKVEVSKLGDSIQVGQATSSFPTFSTRDVETTAVVMDGESLVIGGIFSEDRSSGRSGIPYLMDIPVFGWFFRRTTDTLTERTELIIIITPHVIRNLEESRKVTDEFRGKLSTVAAEIERMRRGGARDDLPPPKIVVPEPESRVIPQLAPESNPSSGPDGGSQSGTRAVAPAEISLDAQPSGGAWKSVLKFLSFGLVQ